MLPVIEARAPGKLVIVGEYAVLYGAPGISVAVDLQAQVRLASRPGADSEIVIPDTGAHLRFQWNADGTPGWCGPPPGSYALPLESCIATLRARGLWPPSAGLSACLIELDTAAFHSTDKAERRIKLGLGSSAAVLVALMGALLKFVQAAALTRAELTELCCVAHRHLQGGKGSGIDVATAIAGGVISIDPAPEGQGPHTSALSWPHDLHLLAIWSGNSASTPAMLGRLQNWRAQQAAACNRHMTELSEIAAETLSAWQHKDASAVLASLDSYASALRRLDQAAGIGICSGGHQAMSDIARTHGAVYKPSGAGGGDFGIALTTSTQVRDALARDFATRGYSCLEAGLCAPGLAVTATTAQRM